MKSAGTSEQRSTRRQSVALIVAGAALVTTLPTVLLGWAVSEYLWELWWLNAGSSGLLDGVPDRPVVVRALAGLVLLLVVVLCALGVATRTRARGELAATGAARWALLGAAIPVGVLASALVLQALLAGPEQPPFVPFS